MKQNHRYKRLAMLLVLVFTLATVATVSTSTVSAVDLSHPCSLTVIPGSSDLIKELAEAGVVIDLYKVADAQEVGSSDSYTYQFLAGYGELKVSDSPDNAEWRKLSQQAAKIALNGSGSGNRVVTGGPSGEAVTSTDAGNNLSSGLYLVVARGQGLNDYITTVKDESGNERLATVAYSQNHIYTFAPELVSLPGKEANANGGTNTANSSEWLYDMSITLKPEQSNRNGSLVIVKTLNSYSTSAGPATFVFSVDAVLNGKNVYSDVISINFTEPGQKSYRIENLPVGAQVTVSEVYSGACYTLTTDQDQSTVIPADGVTSVTFTNNYSGSANSGGGITNRFEYRADTDWSCTQIPAGEE